MPDSTKPLVTRGFRGLAVSIRRAPEGIRTPNLLIRNAHAGLLIAGDLPNGWDVRRCNGHNRYRCAPVRAPRCAQAQAQIAPGQGGTFDPNRRPNFEGRPLDAV